MPPLSTPVRQLTQSSNVTLAIGVGGTLNGIAGILAVGPQDFEAILCTRRRILAYLSKTDMTAAETAQRFSATMSQPGSIPRFLKAYKAKRWLDVKRVNPSTSESRRSIQPLFGCAGAHRSDQGTPAAVCSTVRHHGCPHAAVPAGRLIETQWLPAEKLCANLCPA